MALKSRLAFTQALGKHFEYLMALSTYILQVINYIFLFYTLHPLFSYININNNTYNIFSISHLENLVSP